MKTIIVTGGAGFIGSNFTWRALARYARRVVVVDKLTYAGSWSNVQPLQAYANFSFVQEDISDGAALTRVIDQVRPDAVVNFAAETHVDRSIDGPRRFVVTNVNGTFELLEAARAYWQRLGPLKQRDFRFLQVSTDEVYGSLNEIDLFDESSPYAPNSPYAASKAGADHFVRAYHQTFGLPTLISNCSNNYGFRQFPEKLIPLTILNAIEGKPLPIYGNGLNVRDWLFVGDHCQALFLILAHGRIGESYNIGGRNELTNIEVVTAVCQALEEVLPAKHNSSLSSRGISDYRELITFVADRPGHDRRYAVDSSKLERELGWTRRLRFEKGIRATVRWYLLNRAWCEAIREERYKGERLGLSILGRAEA